jgi:hypothetical protein
VCRDTALGDGEWASVGWVVDKDGSLGSVRGVSVAVDTGVAILDE